MKYVIQLILYFLVGSQGFGLPPATNGESLGILVMGSIVSRNPAKRDNVALIKETATGKVRAVKKGFRVLNRFVVRAITDKYIVVWNQGEGEKLIYQSKYSNEFSTPAPNVTPSQDVSNSAFLSQRDTYKEDGFERDSQNNITMTSSYRDKLLGKELSTVLMQATAEAHMENGRIVGFRMHQIDPGSIYDKAGVRDGDIITSINGRPLNSIPGAIGMLKNLKGSNRVDFNVKRGDTSQNFKMNVD